MTMGMPKWLLGAVAEQLEIPVDTILGADRSRRVADARHGLCWLLRYHTAMSYPAIGVFVRRDHSTVLHAVRRVDRGTISDEIKLMILAVTNRMPNIQPAPPLPPLRGLPFPVRITYDPTAPTGPSAVLVYERLRVIFGAAALELAALCPEGQEREWAITKLEESMRFAHAAIAAAPG